MWRLITIAICFIVILLPGILFARVEGTVIEKVQTKSEIHITTTIQDGKTIPIKTEIPSQYFLYIKKNTNIYKIKVDKDFFEKINCNDFFKMGVWRKWIKKLGD